MPKISDEPLVAVKLRLFKSDYERIKTIYGSGNVHAAKVIRTIVRSFVRQTESQMRAKVDEVEGQAQPGADIT